MAKIRENQRNAKVTSHLEERVKTIRALGFELVFFGNLQNASGVSAGITKTQADASANITNNGKWFSQTV